MGTTCYSAAGFSVRAGLNLAWNCEVFGAGVPEPGTGQIHLSLCLESWNRKPVVRKGLEGSNPSPGAMFSLWFRILTFFMRV